MIVQGEGRGHLTQAIAFKQMMDEENLDCTGVLAGTSKFRQLPDFFSGKLNHDIFYFKSPDFIKNKKNKNYLVFRSIIYNLLVCPVYFRSIFFINKKIRSLNPDIIFNFYEPLTGLWKLLFHSDIPVISIAHQYFYYHPDFKMRGKFKDRFFIRLLNKAGSYGSDLLLAIHPEKKESYKNIIIIPPLLRKEIMEAHPSNNGHFTVYLLNHGYAGDLIKWHQSHSNYKIECFWDNPDKNEIYEIDENLIFFRINDSLYIKSVSSSEGLLCTAGYEAICEAVYLGKPVLVVPVKNHFEQMLNSGLFNEIGFGLVSDTFDPEKLITFDMNIQVVELFRNRVNQSRKEIIDAINSILQVKI